MLIPCPDHCWHIKFCLVFQWHTVFSSHIVTVRSHLPKHLHKVIMPARICVFNATAKIYASRKGNKNSNKTYCIRKKKKNTKSRHIYPANQATRQSSKMKKKMKNWKNEKTKSSHKSMQCWKLARRHFSMYSYWDLLSAEPRNLREIDNQFSLQPF